MFGDRSFPSFTLLKRNRNRNPNIKNIEEHGTPVLLRYLYMFKLSHHFNLTVFQGSILFTPENEHGYLDTTKWWALDKMYISGFKYGYFGYLAKISGVLWSSFNHHAFPRMNLPAATFARCRNPLESARTWTPAMRWRRKHRSMDLNQEKPLPAPKN